MAAKNKHKTFQFSNFFNRWWFAAIFALSVIFFIALRIQPLLHHMVPYTYDQGRDLLQAANIILERKPTFLGPTTGVMGLFHGAWWYYVLIIPYLLFKGLPVGFYYFNFAIQFGVFLIFTWFLFHYLGKSIAAAMALIIATSPYFQMTSLFIGNNIMVIPTLLVFTWLNYAVFSTKINDKKVKQWVVFGLGLSLGLIAEFELSFGMFLIPLYIVAIFLFSSLRKAILHIPHALLFSAGLLIAFSLRIFFELRHGFLQTKTLIGFFITPHLYNPKPYIDVFKDRVVLFRTYFEGLSGNWIVLTIIAMLFVFLLLFVLNKRRSTPVLRFFLFLLAGLFFLSTFYKDNFWANYYEGILLIFLTIMSILLNLAQENQVKKILLSILIVILVFAGFTDSIRSFYGKPRIEGLIKMEKVIDYIDSKIGTSDGNYCVKIYTPPAIPYTYNYLFLYKKLRYNIPLPQSQWVHNRCWFVLERDDYEARKVKWMNDQGLDRSKKLEGTIIVDTDIQYFEIKEKP
jgi:hypothetical protein